MKHNFLKAFILNLDLIWNFQISNLNYNLKLMFKVFTKIIIIFQVKINVLFYTKKRDFWYKRFRLKSQKGWDLFTVDTRMEKMAQTCQRAEKHFVLWKSSWFLHPIVHTFTPARMGPQGNISSVQNPSPRKATPQREKYRATFKPILFKWQILFYKKRN